MNQILTRDRRPAARPGRAACPPPFLEAGDRAMARMLVACAAVGALFWGAIILLTLWRLGVLR